MQNKYNKVLRIKAYQPTAVYRNPVTAEVIESYPLPPPSTILGLISTLIKEPILEKDSINISIQGSYDSLLKDYQWYKKYESDKPYPILVHTLYDVNLIIHLGFSNEILAERVKSNLLNPSYYLYLGRAEDLLKIEDIEFVNPEIKYESCLTIKYNSYIEEKQARLFRFDSGSVFYRLPSYLSFIQVRLKKGLRTLRDFEWVNLFYVEAGGLGEADSDVPLFFDGEYYIWWCMQNPILDQSLEH
ncbi:MAG: type I-B CRISPR-associated protein Cas5b [Candidatus Nitrosocaldaceae archaeon]